MVEYSTDHLNNRRINSLPIQKKKMFQSGNGLERLYCGCFTCTLEAKQNDAKHQPIPDCSTGSENRIIFFSTYIFFLRTYLTRI